MAAVGAAALYRVILAGPEPVGWLLAAEQDGGSNITLRVRSVVPGSAAERAGLARKVARLEPLVCVKG
jgi:hypothetical protein